MEVNSLLLFCQSNSVERQLTRAWLLGSKYLSSWGYFDQPNSGLDLRRAPAVRCTLQLGQPLAYVDVAKKLATKSWTTDTALDVESFLVS